MTDREEDYYDNSRSKNHRIGADLYRQDKQRNQQTPEYKRPLQKEWNEGNHFHTGPSSHGAQDRNRITDERRERADNSSSPRSNAHLNDHYGSRSNSVYRNERNHINHGDSRSGNNYQPHNDSYNDPSRYTRSEDKWREHPGGSSRYKEDDYRYGSGSHNWYREGRYTHDEDNRSRDDRGFIERVGSGIKNTWNDIMHSDDPDYRSESYNQQRQSERISSRERYGSEPYRSQNRPDTDYNGYDRSRDKGFERGPRWADETDSGEDNYYNDTDRSQRYRR
jgi:hypothetical protein